MSQQQSATASVSRLALVADVFSPLRSSGAVQLRDLAREFSRQGYEVTVMVAAPDLGAPWRCDMWNGVRVLRLRTPQTKDVSYLRRTVAELLMPFAMKRNLKRSPVGTDTFDAVVWYSPSIFLGALVSALKKRSNCPSYLIIRDIFPEWAVDMGLMGRGLIYKFFDFVANYQYSVADVIGVQTSGNLAYFASPRRHQGARIEVLHNWLAPANDIGCSVRVNSTALRGRKIFVYAGNMGIAQGMGTLLDLAERMYYRKDVGFLFVGRGSDVAKLRADAIRRGLDNVVFAEEIDPDEIPGLYAQCHVGLVALDPRHKTHNIPGKFLTYMQAGLPVLASINAGNDLAGLIAEAGVGRACIDGSPDTLAAYALDLLEQLDRDKQMAGRCQALSTAMFSSATAVNHIISAMKHECHRLLNRNAGPAVKSSPLVDAEEAAPQYTSEL